MLLWIGFIVVTLLLLVAVAFAGVEHRHRRAAEFDAEQANLSADHWLEQTKDSERNVVLLLGVLQNNGPVRDPYAPPRPTGDDAA